MQRQSPVIYVDVSQWFHSKSTTGIQRVLREAIIGLQRIKNNPFQVIPVVARCGQFYALNDGQALTGLFEQPSPVTPELKKCLTGVKYRIKQVPPVAFTLINFYTLLASLRKKRWSYSVEVNKLPISVTKQDVLLLMDAFWPPYLDVESATRWFKSNNGHALFLVHDLIPIVQVQFREWTAAFIFKRRLLSLAALSNQNLVVSQNQLDKITTMLPQVDSSKFKVIHLGADGPKDKIAALGMDENPIKRDPNLFIMVGSVSARKRHDIVLEAFDILQASGHHHLRLVVAGDGVPALGRIRKIIDGHLPTPTYLSILGKVTDKTLSTLYAQASACIFASEDEGFGIPLWEAQCFRTPVIASDIPIFREIGNQNVTYFKCNNSTDLAEVLKRHTYSFTEIELRTWEHFAGDLLAMSKSLISSHSTTSEL